MCGKVANASILDMPRRVYPAAAFYTLSRFVGADAQVFGADAWIVGADARPRKPAARLIASRRSASARRHWTLRRCLGPCRLAEAPFGSSRLPDTKAAPRADTKLHESSARYCGYSLPISVFVAESGTGRKRAANFSCLFVWRDDALSCPCGARRGEAAWRRLIAGAVRQAMRAIDAAGLLKQSALRQHGFRGRASAPNTLKSSKLLWPA